MVCCFACSDVNGDGMRVNGFGKRERLGFLRPVLWYRWYENQMP